MRNLKLVIIAATVILSSCKKDEEITSTPNLPSTPTIEADFEATIQMGENQAIVSLKNLSENSTSYEWAFPDGTPDQSSEENPITSYIKNGTYSITLTATNGSKTSTKTKEITIDGISDNGYVPYRYLENDGIFVYYETSNLAAYQKLIPEKFNMPSRTLVHVFINDFYKLDYGAIPYKENALFILVEYQGKEFWHCIYMPVTDQHSVTAGRLGLGLPKTLGEVTFTRNDPNYIGYGKNPHGGTMDVTLNTTNYTIDKDTKQELIDLTSLKALQIRNGKIIQIGKTVDGQSSIIQTAELLPNKLTLKFGEATVSTNTDAIAFNHPLDLTPSKIIGGYYLKNTIPFSLTGDNF